MRHRGVRRVTPGAGHRDLAGLAAALGLIGSDAIVFVVVCAVAGAFVESGLGATLEKPGILNNDLLNFINTAVAAALVLALA